MKEIINTYQDNLIYIFRQDQLINPTYRYLVIVKDGPDIIPVEGCHIMHYQEDFESLLKFSLPTKNRKTKQLISLKQCEQLINEITYGVLAFSVNDLPYSVALNHIVLDGHLYFHCAKSGFKLKGINSRVSYLVIRDLGINKEVGTHNHESVAIYGTLKEITDFETKKNALLKLVSSLAPKHPYQDQMVKGTTILELEIDYMIGKSHIR